MNECENCGKCYVNLFVPSSKVLIPVLTPFLEVILTGSCHKSVKPQETDH